MADHIKITDVAPRVQYTANGTLTAFTYPFAIFQASDLEVFEGDTVQALDTHYTVSGAGESDGGIVTFLTAPLTATVITLRRRLVMQRTSDFQESGSLRAKTLNDEFDYQTAVLQQLGDEQARSLRLAATDVGALGTLPPQATRAGKFLAFDANGDPMTSDGSSAGVTISSAMTPVVQAASVAAGRTAFGFAYAAQAEAEAGTSEVVAMTPLGTAQAIDAQARKQGLETFVVPALAMTGRTTNGPDEGLTESSTNKVMVPTFDFDQTTQQFAQFGAYFPKSWDRGTISFIPIWRADSSSGGVVWPLQAVALSDDDAVDAAFGTEQTSVDTLLATTDIQVGPASAAMTIAGSPAAGDWVVFQIKRNVSHESDTLAADALLIGVVVLFSTNAADDA